MVFLVVECESFTFKLGKAICQFTDPFFIQLHRLFKQHLVLAEICLSLSIMLDLLTQGFTLFHFGLQRSFRNLIYLSHFVHKLLLRDQFLIE